MQRSVVALFSAEAEYIKTSSTVRSICWNTKLPFAKINKRVIKDANTLPAILLLVKSKGRSALPFTKDLSHEQIMKMQSMIRRWASSNKTLFTCAKYTWKTDRPTYFPANSNTSTHFTIRFTSIAFGDHQLAAKDWFALKALPASQSFTNE